MCRTPRKPGARSPRCAIRRAASAASPPPAAPPPPPPSRYGRVADYLKKADSEICLLVQVETRSALEELEAIATAEGVDGAFSRPSHLPGSLRPVVHTV